MTSHRVVKFVRPIVLGAAAVCMLVMVALRPDTTEVNVSAPSSEPPAAAGLQPAHLRPEARPARSPVKKPDRSKPRAARPSTVRAGGAPPALGVQFHGMWQMYWTGPAGLTPTAMFTRHLDQLAAHRVSVLRVDLGWSGSQPTSAPPSASSNYNRKFATVLRAANVRGMKVLVTVHQSPAWTRPGTGSEVKQLPRNADAIRPWMQFMARTYGSRVLAWEIWNEPNLEEFTGISGSYERAARYVPVLKAAATGLRAGQRNARVVFGGPAQTDDAFIADAYKLGAKRYFDVMAFHPYQGNQTTPPEAPDTQNARWRITHLPAVVRVMAAYGDAQKPIWWT
ncbi:MAG TPA: cellulase family glycosylhydrolase, partial [Cryptosporangiaceae bacterium]|nr:cellulase family glycosylhydrolase [Cryptosporangiaceae bacterium]